MKPQDRPRGDALRNELAAFEAQGHHLPGIQDGRSREALIEYVLESIRRVNYVSLMRTRGVAAARSDPRSDMFDPVMAAIVHKNAGRIDEAFWLTFLAVHFGKSVRSEWRLVRDVYGSLGAGPCWDWDRTSGSPEAFRQWLADHQHALKHDGVVRQFGNHRKYQSLDARKHGGTGAAVESYVRWVGPSRSHARLVQEMGRSCAGDRYALFDASYRSMDSVESFGRMAKFDYITMLGKLGLAPVEPGSPYLHGATGPVAGARLLFEQGDANTIDVPTLEKHCIAIGQALHVGMQVIEDALCNWQKNPQAYKQFRG